MIRGFWLFLGLCWLVAGPVEAQSRVRLRSLPSHASRGQRASKPSISGRRTDKRFAPRRLANKLRRARSQRRGARPDSHRATKQQVRPTETRPSSGKGPAATTLNKARRRARRAAVSARKGLRVLSRLTAPGFAAIARVLGPPYRRLARRVTGGLDRLERGAPPWLKPVVRGLRDLGPGHIATFILHRAQADPVFLLSYFGSSTMISQAATPFLMALGVDPLTSFLARYATKPVDVAVLFVRERQLRRKADPSLTSLAVARDIIREYRAHAQSRRQLSRAFRPGAGTQAPPGAIKPGHD